MGDIAGLTKKTSLVDVCCGTGTIGLTLADRVVQVSIFLMIFIISETRNF